MGGSKEHGHSCALTCHAICRDALEAYLSPKQLPFMQAQVMKGKAAEIRMDGVHRPSPTSLPVMFFGTLEIAWISPTETSKWQDGIKANMHTKPKGRKAFDIALQQVLVAVHKMLGYASHLHSPQLSIYQCPDQSSAQL